MLGTGIMERKLLDELIEVLNRLPNVQVKLCSSRQSASSDRNHDARAELRVGGKAVTLPIDVKKTLFPRDVRHTLWKFQDFARGGLQSKEGA